MSVQFILGRAGTGKTQHIITDIVRQAKAQPLGPPIYWLVPNQATFITQRRLMEHLPAAARIEVLGPNRLAEKLLLRLGSPTPDHLSAARRLLVLSQALNSVRDRLIHFRASARLPGFITALDVTLRKLVRENQTGDGLRSAAVQLSESGQTHLAAKMHDLALLLEAWYQSVGIAKFDPDQLPNYLLSQLSQVNQPLNHVCLYIDAFSSMSGIEIDLVSGLAAHCKSVVISLLLDPHAINSATPHFNGDGGIFRRTMILYQRLLHRFNVAGIDVRAPICLSTPHRFANADIQKAEARLAGEPEPISIGAAHTSDCASGEAAGITLALVPDVLAEVVYAAREIRKLICGGMRYRDIGIITNAINAYDEPITRIFNSYGIPVFIDRHKPVALHPVTSAARALLRLGAADYRFSDVICLLRSGLTPCTDDDINAFENFALAHALTRHPLSQPWVSRDAGGSASSTDAHRQTAANRVRKSLHQLLSDWLGRAHDRSLPGDRWVDAFRHLLFSPAARVKLEAQIDQAIATGDPASAELHVAIREQMDEIFDAVAAELAGQTITFAEFTELITTLLDGLLLRVIPPTIDQVLVTSSQRSRHPEFRVVFILAFREGQFPLATDDHLLLNPSDRQRVGVLLPDLFPQRNDDVLAAPFFDYVALTRASQRIHLTRPRVDNDGARSAESIYESQLADLIMPSGPPPDAGRLQLAQITSPHDALLFAAQSTGRIVQENNNTSADQFLATLASDAPAPFRRQWIELRNRIIPSPLGRVDAVALLQRPDTTMPISVSALETYAQCPLQHYFKHLLQLRPRDKWKPDALEVGSTTHEVLELIFKDIITRRGPLAAWPDVTDTQIRAAVRDRCNASGVAAIASGQATELLPLIDLLAVNISGMLGYQARLARTLHMRPKATEHRFTVKLPQLCPVGDTGHACEKDNGSPQPHPGTATDVINRITIIGKMDRIDISADASSPMALIFDYKSSARKLSSERIAAGLELQLLSYLLALRQLPEFEGFNPIGALYQPLRPEIATSPDGPGDQPSGDETESEPQPRLTMIANGLLDYRMIGAPISEMAHLLGTRMKKDGQPYANSSMVERQKFDSNLSCASNSMAWIAQNILRGYIEPSPVQISSALTACDQCDYKACCPFDRIEGEYRPIRPIAQVQPLEHTP